MKKVLFAVCLALTTGLFTSCQKGENFFYGTWQAVERYSYKDKNGDWYYDISTIECTLSKNGDASLVIDYPKEPKDNIKRDGTYKFYNDNTIAVTFKETKEYDEWVFLAYKSEDGNRLYGGEWEFTKIKNK